MIRRTLMQRDQELADFEVDPATGKVRITCLAENAAFTAHAGLTPEKAAWVLSGLVERRALSPLRKDKEHILAACGATSPIDLAFRGFGLSLSDLFWYRTPGAIDRWEDINFFQNAWDPRFGDAVLAGNYESLASCSPNVPEVTTSGHAVKRWEQNDEGIFLIKAAEYPEGAELAGAQLASQLCALLFPESDYVPVTLTQRAGQPCSASPVMVAHNEELVDGNRLCALAGIPKSRIFNEDSISTQAYNALIEAYETMGIAQASAHVAKMACFSCLALLLDFNPSNFGAIHAVDQDEWRPAPIYDFDGAFGFPFKDITISYMCENPLFMELMCAHRFNFLNPAWDWSWYNPHALDGFEERIMQALAPYRSLPPTFPQLVARLFVMQRSYVNKIARA